MSRWLLLASVLASSLVAACSPSPRSDVLVVRSVGPTRLDDGSVLSVLGESFPVGREGTLSLRGTMHRPGAAPRPFERSLPVRVTASDRAEHTLDTDDLGGRGTFVGRVELAFEAATGGRVFGATEALLDVGGAANERTAPEVEAFVERLGVVLDDELPIDGGVVVGEVREGGLAARHGIVEGDRLVGLGELRLRSASDLRPAPGLDEITLRVERPGLSGARDVVLPLGTPSPRDPWLALALALFAAMVVGFGPAGRALASLRAPTRAVVPELVATLALAGAAHFVHVDLAFVAAFVVLPRVVDGFVARRLAAELVPLVVVGIALVVGVWARVDGGPTSVLVLRHPLTLVVVGCALFALARPARLRWLGVLARTLGAVWLAALFFGTAFVAPALVLAAAFLPSARAGRVVSLSIAAGVGSVVLAFAVDLSRPVDFAPDEPRMALLAGAALALAASIAWRRPSEPRAHVFL